MRRILGALCALCLALGLAPSTAVAEASVWDGSVDTAWYTEAGADQTEFQIDTAEELAGLAAIVNGTATDKSGTAIAQDDFKGKTVTLTADISLNVDGGTTPWTPIGNFSDDGVTSNDAPFEGTFDGGGHAVGGLHIDSSEDGQGLFAFVDIEGAVRDLSVAGSVTGNDFVGCVVGFNGGTVEGCSSYATVSGSGTRSYVGGVVGFNGAVVTGCSSDATVSSAGDSVSVGGVVGLNGGTVENCYSSATVSSPGAHAYVGGLVGDVSGSTVENCYSSATVSGAGARASIGGVVGCIREGTVTHCYSLSNATVNSGLPSVGDNENGKVTLCESLSSPTDVVDGDGEPSTAEVSLEDSLNAWVAAAEATAPGTYASWETVEGLNGGWPVLCFSVTLMVDGSSFAHEYTAGVGETLPTDVAKSGYAFDGWYASESLAGDPVTSIPATATGNRTYWAGYTLVTYGVDYNLGGGVNDPSNPASYTVEDDDVVLAAPTRDGYEFAGWVDAEGTAVTSIPAGSTGDVTLTATWEQVAPTVQPVDGDSTSSTPQPIDGGSVGSTPQTGDAGSGLTTVLLAIAGVLLALGVAWRRWSSVR